jgi:hypothetical protein
MKRICALSLAAVIFSAALPAQVKDGITIGAMGQFALTPVSATFEQPGGKGGKAGSVYTGVGGVAANQPRLRVDIRGAGPDGKYGFDLRISTNDLANFGVQDYARAWVAPIPQIRIDAGRFREETLMGKVADNNSARYVLEMKDGNSIFDRFNTGAAAGAFITIKPLAGLFIGAGSRLGPGADWKTGSSVPAALAKDMYKNSQVAAGYTIPGAGLVRAQFLGADHSYSARTANQIQVAFAFTGLEGLTADLGLKYPFRLKDDAVKGVIQLPLHAALGLKFAAGDFDIEGRVDADFAGSSQSESAGTKTASAGRPEFNIHLLPRCNLGFASLGLELGLIIKGGEKTTTETGGLKTETVAEGGVQFGAGLWLFKSWGNGTVQAGLSFQPNGEPVKGTFTQGFIAVPLIFTYTF